MELRNHHIFGLNWKRSHSFLQTANIFLGIILLSLGLIFISLDLVGHRVEVEESVLLITGGLALWAGLTRYPSLMYIIDLGLGLFFIL